MANPKRQSELRKTELLASPKCLNTLLGIVSKTPLNADWKGRTLEHRLSSEQKNGHLALERLKGKRVMRLEVLIVGRGPPWWSYYCWWQWELTQPFWRTVLQYGSRVLKCLWPCDSTLENLSHRDNTKYRGWGSFLNKRPMTDLAILMNVKFENVFPLQAPVVMLEKGSNLSRTLPVVIFVTGTRTSDFNLLRVSSH